MNFLSLYPTWLIVLFVVLIIFMLILDLWVFNKNSHKVSNKEALIFSCVWISLAMVFSLLILWQSGAEKFSEFQAAYWIEKSLSVDNLFVFILVFWYFKISKEYQHKVLFYWIIWAIIFRAIFIFAWVEIIKKTYIDTDIFWLLSNHIHFNPIMALFWIFLVYAWIKSWWEQDEDEEKDLSQSFAFKLTKKFFKTTHKFDGSKFFTIENWVKLATPLLVALVVIEITDLVFAVDSIPAIFGVSTDPFILYTSNIFAILWLRSLYFLLANSIWYFSKLHYGLAFILSFIWIKMIIAPVVHISTNISLAIIAIVLIWTMAWSILSNKKEQK